MLDTLRVIIAVSVTLHVTEDTDHDLPSCILTTGDFTVCTQYLNKADREVARQLPTHRCTTGEKGEGQATYGVCVMNPGYQMGFPTQCW